MQLPSLPQPSVSTFVLAAHSVLEGLHQRAGIPLHHALVMLQQHIWGGEGQGGKGKEWAERTGGRVHSPLGDRAAITPVYAPALEQFVHVGAATDTAFCQHVCSCHPICA